MNKVNTVNDYGIDFSVPVLVPPPSSHNCCTQPTVKRN